MKIAYLSTFYPFRGGIAQFNASLFRIFEREHEIRAYTFTRQYPNFLFPGTSQYVTEDDNPYKILSVEILDSINPFTYIKTAGQIKKFNPDLLITKFWMPFFAPSLGWVVRKLKKSGTLAISILDNIIPHERRIGDIAQTKFFLRNNHGFIVMSKAVERDLLSLKPDAHYVEHPHPLYDHFGKRMEKAKAREILKIDDNRKVLLFFGFIRSYKGLDLALRAMKFLPEDYLLLVAGEMYGDFKEYENIIKENNIESKVHLNIKYISDEETALYFSAADVCFLPYKSATQSGIIGISYNFDLPVIATNVGGLREMIEPFDTGILVPAPVPELLAKAAVDYFQNNMMGKYSRNIAQYKINNNWETLAAAILQLYSDIVHEK